MKNISTIDLVVIVLYLAGIVGAGIWGSVYASGKVVEAGGYFLAGNTVSWLVVGSVDQILKEYFGLENIFRLLFSRNLALDCYRARVIHSLQFLKNAWKVDSSCPDRNFFSKMSRVGREETVFRVNSANEVTNNIHSVYWISLSIKNKVGQIQVYKNVIQTHILNHA